MNTKFKVDGCYEIEIAGDGHLKAADGMSAAFSRNRVGLQVNYTPVASEDGDGLKPRTVASFMLKRSQARAIASAMLCAVADAAED